MFERYSEKARRAVFFARYEASQFGSPSIEAEHLLLGILREDRTLANRFLPLHVASDSIRSQIEAHIPIRKKILMSVDLPVSQECKRVLAYGAEESERLKDKFIGTPHLLLGLLREERSFPAQLLLKQGLTLDSVRRQVQMQHSETPSSHGGAPAVIAGLDRWLADLRAASGLWTVKQDLVANTTAPFAIYTSDPSKENDKLRQAQMRIDSLIQQMERAIANHEFEKARRYSDEERKERENLRLLREQLHLEEPPRIPLLRVEIIRDDRFSDIQARCDHHIAEGVAYVWILDPNARRAYTVTKTEGLRECKNEILQIADPPLQMDLKKIFA